MGRAGRPLLLEKEGHHRHDGYSRWHPVDQVHRPDLHSHIQKSNDVHVEIEPATAPESDNSVAFEMYTLISSLEKMEYGKALLFELQNSIKALMRARQMQRDKKPPEPINNDQASIGGSDAEDREPNTYGLP